ncbi:MAG: (p)ppGpp synthetase [Tissierellia bacterium]|nr:(p)ppGpp synthetase [Tissierellia bacterium]
MKLKVFEFVEETLDLLDAELPYLQDICVELEQYFIEHFGGDDSFLSINYRIKSDQSLKEKIIRNNTYLRYDSPTEVLESLSDLIGLRIECRFIKDENKMYQLMLQHFLKEGKNGQFFAPGQPSISLDLRARQPQIQKNGFEIYKIDGIYYGKGKEYKFELQIKSLVNVFWGEIDHRILYKNYNYMLTESFFRDIMHSMKDNLAMIDRQLMILYNHVNSLDSSAEESNRIQIKSLLSKIIHDIYVNKVREELGFLIDFKKTTDTIVEFLYAKCGMRGSHDYGENFIRLLNRINKIGEKQIDFREYVFFDKEPVFSDAFSKMVGEEILKVINWDFGWNLFFKIIFEIEEGDKVDNFLLFVEFLRQKILCNLKKSLSHLDLTLDEMTEIQDYILGIIAEDYARNMELEYVLDKSFNNYIFQIHSILLGLNNYDDFLKSKERLRQSVLGQRSYDYVKPRGI